MELSKNHILQGGKYRIIEKIGQGGFAITYKANFATEVTGTMGKITTDVTVAIKEFFFADYCVRDSDSSFITVSSPTGNQIFGKFKEKLRKEATILSRLRHPNIVSVFDIFEENNTIYMVMEYIDGFSLKQTIINQGGHLNEATTLRYASQLCEAVAEIHRNNVLHLDIKPGNILIDNNDNVKLIDFGISKQYNSETHTETSTTPVGISKGFAPLEQYTGVSQFSPATDIYAIGATIYNMLSGQIPPESMYLLEEDLPRINGVSNQMWTAITSAMSTRRNQRPQTVSELIALFPEANKIASPVIAHNIMQSDEKTQIAAQNTCTPLNSQPKAKDMVVHLSQKSEIFENQGVEETNQFIDQDSEDQKNPTKRNFILFICSLISVIIIAYIIYSKNNSVPTPAFSDSVGVDTALCASSSIPTTIDTFNEQTKISHNTRTNDKKKQEPNRKIVEEKNSNKKKKLQETFSAKSAISNSKTVQPKPEPEKIFTTIEQKPQFPGGEAALMKWLSSHINYPTMAQEEGAQGRVVVQFVVERDGRVGQAKIARGIHPALDKEALRLVKSLPKFIPGKNNGQEVRCWFTLPINFKLNY